MLRKPAYRYACGQTRVGSCAGSQLFCPNKPCSTLETVILRATSSASSIFGRHRVSPIGQTLAASWSRTKAFRYSTIMGREESRHVGLRQAHWTTSALVSASSKRRALSLESHLQSERSVARLLPRLSRAAASWRKNMDRTEFLNSGRCICPWMCYRWVYGTDPNGSL